MKSGIGRARQKNVHLSKCAQKLFIDALFYDQRILR